MNAYLSRSVLLYKESHLKVENAYPKYRIILGNESCDLDSAVSALVYAYCLQNRDPDILTLCMLNLKREEVPSRTEVNYFFNENGINIGEFPTRDEINLTELKDKTTLELVLVDHHTLSKEDEDLRSKVVEVIDHRPKIENWENCTIEIVGSCCTLIAEKIINKWSYLLTDEMCKLLLGPIILDTYNLCPEAGRATPKDELVVQYLTNKIRSNLLEKLIFEKSNISSLSNMQVLKKDLKIIGNVPIIGLPVLVQDLVSMREDLHETLIEFQQNYHNVPLILLLGIRVEGETIRKDLAVFGQEHVTSRLVETFLKSNLEMVEVKGCVFLRIFNQGNIKLSRKQIGPLVCSATAEMAEIRDLSF